MLFVFRFFRHYVDKKNFFCVTLFEKSSYKNGIFYFKKFIYLVENGLNTVNKNAPQILFQPTAKTSSIVKFEKPYFLLNALHPLHKFYTRISNVTNVKDYPIDETSANCVTHEMKTKLCPKERKKVTIRKRKKKKCAKRKKKERISKRKAKKLRKMFSSLSDSNLCVTASTSAPAKESAWNGDDDMANVTPRARSYSDVVKSDNVLRSEGVDLKKFIKDVRYTVDTPYGKWIKGGWLDERAKSGAIIKVLSYNILAQHLLEQHPYLYESHDERYLSWEYRSEALIKEFKMFDADILCLQEVEAEKASFFDSKLKTLGYKGLFKKRTNNKHDGCAIYYRENKFDLREHATVEYCQPGFGMLDRDNIGLVVRLSPKNRKDQSVVVATTHLLFNPKRHDIRLAQMQILLAEIERIAYRSDGYRGECPYYPIILTGDFNLLPFSFVYDLLMNGYIDHIEQVYTNPLFQRRQLIPTQLGITDSCQHYDVLKHRTYERTETSDFKHVRLYNSDQHKEPGQHYQQNDYRGTPFQFRQFGSGSLYYNLNLSSVYPHYTNTETDSTTFHKTWCNVDYIFYGPMWNMQGRRLDGELKLISYLRLPRTSEAVKLKNIPNECCPSDHLPLIATFHLPTKV